MSVGTIIPPAAGDREGERLNGVAAGYAAIANKSSEFLIGDAMVLLLYGAMSMVDAAHTEAAAWFVEADQPDAATRRARSQAYDESIKSARLAIVSSLFLVLLGAGILLGGHAAIDPLLQSAVEARQAKGVGEVLYAMPDGIFCRHVAFDNLTAQVSEGSLEHCVKDGDEQLRPSRESARHVR